jgi:hypothetical protein
VPRARLTALLLLLLTAAGILAREPRLLLEPRMWGEDGSNYYRFAFQNGWLDALLYLPLNGPGYYSFAQDAASLLAVLLGPPERAAQVFLWLSLLAQLSPALVVLFGRSHVWDTTGKRALVCALLVLSPAAGIEVWLNLVIAMNHLGLAALCVLMEDLRPPVSRGRAWGLRLLLLVGGLTGPWVVALAPLFILKARAERSRESKVQLGVVLATCAVQAAVVVATLSQGALDRERAAAVPLVLMLDTVAVAHVLRPIFGGLLDRFVELAALGPALRGGAEPAVYWHGLLLLLPLLAAVTALLVPPPSRWQRWTLLGGLVLSSAVAAVGAYGVAVGRYAFIPGLAVGLLLVDNLGAAATRWQRARRRISAVLLAASLAAGAWGWHDHRADPGWEADYPAWTQEVERWRANPDHALVGMPRAFRVPLQRRGIAADLKAELARLEGLTFSPSGRHELLLPVRGIPAFGRLVLELDSAVPSEGIALSLDFLQPDGTPLASGRMVEVRRRSRPGHPVLADALARGPGLGRVAALRLRLTAPDGGDSTITIRRARFGDELLFF